MDLPDKIVDIDVLRINRNINKKCTCENKKFVIDTTNRSVHCSQCGSLTDPYDALYYLAGNYERLNNQVNNLLEQKKEIDNYKPYLKVFKSLEQSYKRTKNQGMLPCCPECQQPFYFEHVTSWINRGYVTRLRTKEGKPVVE